MLKRPVNRIFIVVFACIILLVTILSIYLLQGKDFVFLLSTPATGDVVSSDLKEATIVFNAALDPQKLPVVTAYPTTALVTAADNATLRIFFPKGLQEDKNYSLLLRDTYSIDGKHIDTMSITFYSEDRSPAARLKRETPIEKSDFSLNYDRPTKQFFVIARIANQNALYTQIEAIFQSYGLKSADYKIEYQFSNAANSKLNPDFQPQVEEYTGDGSPPPPPIGGL